MLLCSLLSSSPRQLGGLHNSAIVADRESCEEKHGALLARHCGDTRAEEGR